MHVCKYSWKDNLPLLQANFMGVRAFMYAIHMLYINAMLCIMLCICYEFVARDDEDNFSLLYLIHDYIWFRCITSLYCIWCLIYQISIIIIARDSDNRICVCVYICKYACMYVLYMIRQFRPAARYFFGGYVHLCMIHALLLRAMTQTTRLYCILYIILS